MSPDELIIRVLVLLAISLAATAFAWRARLLKRRVAVVSRAPRSAAANRAEPTLPGASAGPVDDRLAETLRQQALCLALRAAPAAGAAPAPEPGAVPGDAALPARPALLGQLLASAQDGVAPGELLEALRREPVLLAALHDHAGGGPTALDEELRLALETGRAADAGAATRLRVAIGVALLQPLFAARHEAFAGFAACAWTLARDTGLAAAAAARRTHDCDPAAACVLGLVHGLAPLLELRDALAGEPALAQAAPELLAARIAQRADATAHRIAVAWELPAALRSALAEHSALTAPARMSALGRALHAGRLSGPAALLGEHALREPEVSR